jgi:hypothetical protein
MVGMRELAMRRTKILSALLVLTLTTPLFASSEDDVIAIVKAAVNSPEPTTAVFEGFASLPDFDLEGPSIAAALAAGGAPEGGVIAQILGGLTSIKKSGNTVAMQRSAAVTIPIVVAGETKGYVGLAKDVSFDISKQGDAIKVSNTNGTSVGTASDSLHDMKSLTFTKQGNAPVITLTAGWAFITQTKTFVLPAPAPEAAVATTGLPLPPTPKPAPSPAAPRPAAATTSEATAAPAPAQESPPPETQGIVQKLAG